MDERTGTSFTQSKSLELGETGAVTIKLDQSFKGEYPPPAILKEYPEEICKAISAGVVAEQNHRHVMEKQDQKNAHDFNLKDRRAARRLEMGGLVVAGMIILSCLGCSLFMFAR
jgi:uncharacterized membrane protein